MCKQEGFRLCNMEAQPGEKVSGYLELEKLRERLC